MTCLNNQVTTENIDDAFRSWEEEYNLFRKCHKELVQDVQEFDKIPEACDPPIDAIVKTERYSVAYGVKKVNYTYQVYKLKEASKQFIEIASKENGNAMTLTQREHFHSMCSRFAKVFLDMVKEDLDDADNEGNILINKVKLLTAPLF